MWRQVFIWQCLELLFNFLFSFCPESIHLGYIRGKYVENI